MMGDDMAIRSGGMYGNPASNYTLANAGLASGNGMAWLGKAFKIGVGLMGNYISSKAERNQLTTDLEMLRREKEYNLKNYQQNIADTFAQNKASFYASGLDFTGTALSVARENKRALTEDMQIMEQNYKMQEMSLRNKRTAAEIRGNIFTNAISSVMNLF